MGDAKFRDLAGAAGRGILMALAAGLRVVERAEAVGDLFDFIKLRLIRGMRGVVHQAVGLVVEAGGRLRKRRSKEKNGDGQKGNSDEKFHRHLGGWSGEFTLSVRKSQVENAQKNSAFRYKALMDKLGRFALGPRVIGNAEMDAAGDGWVVVEEKDLYWIGVGVGKSGLAEVLEGLRAGLAGIGDDAAGDFQAVGGGLIVLITAEGASKDIGNEPGRVDE